MIHLILTGATSDVLEMVILALVFIGGMWLIAMLASWLRTSRWKGKRVMRKTVEDFQSLLDHAPKELAAVSEADRESKPAPDKWSRKEILGHLIDSASNNHQRFVRAQLSAELKLPAYEQDAWVNIQRYQNESWESLVQFWKSYNFHLLHVISSIPESAIHNYCFIGSNEPVTLEFLVEDYIRHVKHHLEQILE
jgi:hypothetical protein